MDITSKTKELYEKIDKMSTPLKESQEGLLKVLLKNTQNEVKSLTESGVGDVAQFVPIVLPMVRRVVPDLVAHEVLGVQPIQMPTGYVYSLKYTYTGRGLNADDKTGGRIKPNLAGQILTLNVDVEQAGTLTRGDEVNTSKGTAKVVHIEDEKILLDNKIGVVGEDLKKGDTVIGTITGTYSNELSFAKVLKKYTGDYVTTDAEKLAYDMPEMGLSVDQISISAKSRKLKAVYTVEMLQDLKAMHGVDAEAELIKMMEFEVKSEIDRQIIAKVKEWSAPSTDWIVKDSGRYDFESVAHLALKITKESREIAKLNRRGAANILIASPRVVAVLEATKQFKWINNNSDIKGATGVVGTFNGMKVIQDTFSEKDYVTVLYKGGERDAIGYFAPYVPISFTRVVDPASGQPAIILNTRYGLKENPMNSYESPSIYARTFEVDFTGTILV